MYDCEQSSLGLFDAYRFDYGLEGSEEIGYFTGSGFLPDLDSFTACSTPCSCPARGSGHGSIQIGSPHNGTSCIIDEAPRCSEHGRVPTSTMRFLPPNDTHHPAAAKRLSITFDPDPPLGGMPLFGATHSPQTTHSGIDSEQSSGDCPTFFPWCRLD
jgi:hypothetical protein